MKVFKAASGLRDIIFLIALIAIINAIIERNGELYMRQIKNMYDVHEVDPSFGQKIRQTVKQIDTLSELLPPAELDKDVSEQLASLKTELLNLKEEYEANSPALIALGPIGTASILLKEAEIEGKLLKALNKTGKLIASLTPHKPGGIAQQIPFEPAPTLEIALNNNTLALGNIKA